MTRLALALALLASPAAACQLSSAHVITYTHHVGAEAGQFDEGLSLRGGGVTASCGSYEVTGSAYKNSLHDGGAGYSVSLTHDALAVMLGAVEARPIARLNYYEALEGSELAPHGVFPSFGISFRYQVTDNVGLWLNADPTFGFDKSFDSLIVAGVTWEFD